MTSPPRPLKEAAACLVTVMLAVAVGCDTGNLASTHYFTQVLCIK